MNENMRNFCIILLSLPVWERGLKWVSTQLHTTGTMVAPRVGAWIEINLFQSDLPYMSVAPRVGAWIEMLLQIDDSEDVIVAPRVGAWIEILFVNKSNRRKLVAPRVGAWIEILELKQTQKSPPSLPVWERGLKFVKLAKASRR